MHQATSSTGSCLTTRNSRRASDIRERRRPTPRPPATMAHHPGSNLGSMRAEPPRTIEPVIRSKRGFTWFRHKAVLVDGTHIESVHHIMTRRLSRRGTIAYGSTTLYRTTLETSKCTIFVIDVPNYPRRIIRCRSNRLLKRLFSAGQEKVSVYIPLEQPLENPRYDFLADEDNWA